MKAKLTYLSGAMLDCTDAECRDWREYARLNLKCSVLDPMVRDYRDRPMDGMVDMVHNDKADIDRCDTILVNFIKPSVGTSMEVLYGWERGKHIVVSASPEIVISPWLVYHSHQVFFSIDDAIEYINTAEHE